ncbi:hypothetical protein TRAPUB_14215 [Trametes pubescens]|uniref:Uncharacterized protein n=1 Tax=Trametes pubescens TaxID=154538 RepID=A0A1M2W7R4_TRAPU|nr:hypothetical protein TRAPUB_14215 [Trametes pubescens]
MTPSELLELEAMEYVPLSVVSLESPTAALARLERAPMLAFAAPPYCWLDVGTPVHLHLERTPRYFTGPCGCSRIRPSQDSLAIRGWIEEERVRTDREVVYVVKNEERDAPIQRAFILFGSRLGVPPPPNATGAGQRNATAALEVAAESLRRGPGPCGPLERWTLESWTRTEQMEWMRESSRMRANNELLRGSRGMEEERARQGARTMNLGQPRESQGDCAAAVQPYTMWETYGGAGMSREAKAEEDGIRNYGCPIVVRPRKRMDGPRD